MEMCSAVLMDSVAILNLSETLHNDLIAIVITLMETLLIWLKMQETTVRNNIYQNYFQSVFPFVQLTDAH